MTDTQSRALGFALGTFISVWISQLLWNAVLVKLFPYVHTIGYWQMFGLSILLNSLFNYKYYSDYMKKD